MKSMDWMQYAYKQADYISKNGCRGIKCKNCCMKKLCDHYPEHSQLTALKAKQTLLKMAGN